MDPTGREVGGKRCGHLGPAGVVDADEEDLGYLLGDPSFGLGRGLELVLGVACGEDRQVVGDPGDGLEGLAGLGDRAGHGLAWEDALVGVGELVDDPLPDGRFLRG